MAMGLAFLAVGCSRAPNAPEAKRTSEPQRKSVPRPSPYDENFWHHWSDGKAEVCTYELRGRYSGNAISTLRLDPKHIMHFITLRHIGDSSDLLAVSLALDASAERPAGALIGASSSRQDRWGHDWAQIRFGNTRAFATRHGSGRPDAQQLLDYDPPGFSVDGLMLWARRIAWPRLAADKSFRVDLLTSVRSDSITETELVLSRTNTSATAKSKDGHTVTYIVHPALPHYIKGWQTSDGERAVLVNCERVNP